MNNATTNSPTTPMSAHKSPTVAALEDAANYLDGHGSAFAEESALAINRALRERAQLVEALRLNLEIFDRLAKESPDRKDEYFIGYVFSADKIRNLLRELGEAA